jgi:choice-of-anchor A domain-containing protein
MKVRRYVVAGLATVTLASGAAEASPLSAAYIMANYNLVTSGNATTQSDIEGSAVIGGNFSGATMFGNSSRSPTNPQLDVFGQLSGNLNVNGGLVDYASEANGTHINLNNGAKSQVGNFANPITDFTTSLNQLSAQLASLAPNSSVTSTGTFNAAPVNGIAVFSLTAATLQTDLTNHSPVFNQNGAKTIIVNVTGNFTDPSSSNWNPPAQQDVIFNFVNATSASISVENWEASILAPNAALTIAGGNIEGFVYAASFNGGGELHNIPFTGILPAPEPMSLAIFGVGLLGLGLVRRKTT